MKKNLSWLLGVVVVLLAVRPCGASLLLSLSSAPADLSNLTPGQVVSFQVLLSGLEMDQELEFLAATIGYDSALLSPPMLTAGPIVPDVTGFQKIEAAGLADANYDSLFAMTGSHIVSNGTFFSFDVTVQGFGSGSIAFEFTDALQFNPQDPGTPLDPELEQGSALAFASPATTVIPEPASYVLLSLGIGVLGIAGFRSSSCRRAA
ncbi:MAG: PEP-CTERM sorting domain-containing protein [Gemmataceae bacterium]|nr:PEP-CTERM sorting domain-containing protein [Gemmataceae bacterium]